VSADSTRRRADRTRSAAAGELDATVGIRRTRLCDRTIYGFLAPLAVSRLIATFRRHADATATTTAAIRSCRAYEGMSKVCCLSQPGVPTAREPVDLTALGPSMSPRRLARGEPERFVRSCRRRARGQRRPRHAAPGLQKPAGHAGSSPAGPRGRPIDVVQQARRATSLSDGTTASASTWVRRQAVGPSTSTIQRFSGTGVGLASCGASHPHAAAWAHAEPRPRAVVHFTAPTAHRLTHSTQLGRILFNNDNLICGYTDPSRILYGAGTIAVGSTGGGG